MKNLVFGLILSVFSVSVSAGEGNSDNCYEAYNKKFAERGANEVKDGWYENVVITFRQGNQADCVLGKVQVEKGSVTQMYLKNIDGTYQIFTKKWKHENSKSIVSNGISKSRLTIDNEIVNVIFTTSIKPPKKKIAVAPSPDDL
ncbi:MAG: hypothetical protein CMP63_08575 [Flavobacteriales bacterium]|nr:hypothetical protein [Flavobacteriales bacterium]|tara:strand:+ start:6093 stop:6524 length:432 start_codon:yes stop_codon:yes gene_type:complete